MSLILPSIGAFGYVPDAGAPVTRRKLVSTSRAANTGMHSTSTITMAGINVTVAFWWRPTSIEGAGYADTVWAGHAGNYQIYTGSGSSANVVNLVCRCHTSTSAGPTSSCSQNTWVHVLAHLGEDHASTTDAEIFINGSSEGTQTASASSTEMSSAGTHYILGDDASGSTTDDGCVGEIFDLCVFDGIIAIGDTNYNAGSWKDLSATGLSALKYRIDGQNVSAVGEDSSGNGHDFTVESSGVTLSDTGLPTGANP